MNSQTSWWEYLPPVLQANTVYWICAICFSVGYFCRTLPKSASTQLVRQWAILCAGLATGALLMPTSIVYGLGTGLICSTLSMIGYDLVLAQIEIKLRAIFGAPPPSEPLQYPPASTTSTTPKSS